MANHRIAPELRERDRHRCAHANSRKRLLQAFFLFIMSGLILSDFLHKFLLLQSV